MQINALMSNACSPACPTDLFRDWDENSDGEVDREEFRKAIPLLGFSESLKVVDKCFDLFDADSDGSITCTL